jgi:hypothetical protein
MPTCCFMWAFTQPWLLLIYLIVEIGTGSATRVDIPRNLRKQSESHSRLPQALQVMRLRSSSISMVSGIFERSSQLV